MTTRERDRCREIARRLDQGDTEFYKRAEASLTVEQKGAIWDLRQHVVAKAQRAAGKRTLPPKVDDQQDDLGPGKPDLDDWPVPGDSDDDSPAPPEEEEPSRLCPMCRGSGRDTTGAKCSACDGTGRIAANVDDDDEDDEGARSFYGYIEDEE
jgi:hypothetical protein